MRGVKEPPKVSPLVHLRERDETLLTFDEYLALEETSQTKHEFIRGRRFGMSGASDAHNLISVNVSTALRIRLRGGPCRVYSSDMKVRIKALDIAYYPDVHVECGKGASPKTLFHERPVVIVEVLSPSTSRFDRGEKFEDYRTLRSLRSYVLVSSDRRCVEVRQLNANGELTTMTLSDDEHLSLPELGFAIPIAEFYEDTGITVSRIPPRT